MTNSERRCAKSSVAALCAILIVATAVNVRADLFDVSEGSSVVDHSLLVPGEVAEEMLGLVPDTGPEPGTLIFDGGSQGAIHHVEWEMPGAVEVGRIRLYAAGDSCSSTLRTFDHFRLLALVGESMQVLVDEDMVVPYQYLRPCSLALAMGTPATTATRFRAEFTQADVWAPRVIELDGLPPANCGDANDDGAITATDALILLRASVGTAFCESCVCDVNNDETTTAGDALVALAFAVGRSVELACPTCPISAGVALIENSGSCAIND